jgi:hypothetical protein
MKPEATGDPEVDRDATDAWIEVNKAKLIATLEKKERNHNNE